MQAALALLGLQGVLGAYDNFRNHEFREGLPHRSRQRGELLLHAAREAFYLILFPTMAWLEWRGWLAYLLLAIIVSEIVVTCWDFVEEDRTRKLSANERVLHTLLTLNYGAFLALLAPELLRWSSEPTELAFVSRGFWSWLMTIYSLGVLVFGVREGVSGIAMWRQAGIGAEASPHARVVEALGAGLPAALRAFHDGAGVRVADGVASVKVRPGAGRLLLGFMGLTMRDGRQSLTVTFEPDGDGELWRRDFASGSFTTRIETRGGDGPALVELFGPLSFWIDLLIGEDDISWQVRQARCFGMKLPGFLTPEVTAREWASADGAYEMSAQIALPLLGPLLTYSATLLRAPPQV